MVSYLKIATLVTILGLTANAVAQPGPGWPEGSGQNRRQIRERIKTVKIWKLTEELNLTSKQSEQFFPLYNQFQEEKQQIESARMGTLQRLDELTAAENPPENEISGLLQKLDDYDAQMNAGQIEFREQLKDIISMRQIGRLYVFEIKFQNEIRDILKDAMMERRERRFKDQP